MVPSIEIRGDRTGHGHHADRDGQVVIWALLADGCRREVDDHPLAGKCQPNIAHRREDPLAAFLHGGIWQPNNGHAAFTGSDIHFHFNNHTFKPDDCTGIYAG